MTYLCHYFKMQYLGCYRLESCSPILPERVISTNNDSRLSLLCTALNSLYFALCSLFFELLEFYRNTICLQLYYSQVLFNTTFKQMLSRSTFFTRILKDISDNSVPIKLVLKYYAKQCKLILFQIIFFIQL